MANGHVQPGRSLEFYNDTGADIKSGELFPFGGGVAAKALGDIPAGQTGVVTLHDVHRVPVPDGMTLERGQIVRVDGGRLSDSGDILGRFVGLDKGGWAKILIMPLTEEGGGGGGTTNYNALSNKPRINGVTLSGNQSADDLGISYDDTALKNRVGVVETAVAAIDAQKLDDLADIKTVGNGLKLDAEGTLTATGTGGDAKTFVAEYNVTTAQEIRDYLDAANEPFAPIVVKRGNDYYTAALATRSGDDAAILRVLGSGGGNYILFNYTVRGTAWSSNSYTFQKQLVSGTDIKTVDGQSLLGAGNLATATDWANVANKPAGLVVDAAYVHTDSNYTEAEKTKLAGMANYDDAPLAARVSTLENAGYQTAQDVDDKIADALETFDKLDYKVADSPPTPTTVVIKGQTETTRPGVRYMVKHTTDARYEEYILIDGVIYDIGDTGDLDLSGYATEQFVNDKTLSPTGWGVAKIGTARMTHETGSKWYYSGNIFVDGFASPDDYTVQCISVGGAPQWTFVSNFAFTIKGKGVFVLTGYYTGDLEQPEYVDIQYVVIGKGFGGTHFVEGTGLPTGGATGQLLKKLSTEDGAVDWTDIKTVNNQSLLGSGNINISGGGGQDNVIESISVNGIAQAVDANKNVDLLVPTYSKNTAAFAAYDEGAEFNLQPSTNGMTASWAEGATVVSSELTSKTYVDGELAEKSSFDISSISTAGGGNEVHATLSQDTDTASLNYYKTTELPNALNLNVGSDTFRIPTTGYADEKAAQAQSNAQIYADLKLAQKQDTLVSGTSIKTINSQSLLGSGDINISGSGNSFLITQGVTTYAQISAAYDAGKEFWFIDPNASAPKPSPRPVVVLFDLKDTNRAQFAVQNVTGDGLALYVVTGSTYELAVDRRFQTVPQYQLSNNDSGGNVIQKGEIEIDGVTYGLFEFFFKTGLLPAANATVIYSMANLLASYTIHSFVDATGMTEDGIFIGNGRTDNDNRLIVQQFSKNSKSVTIRAYKDFTTKTATLKILFIGTKN